MEPRADLLVRKLAGKRLEPEAPGGNREAVFPVQLAEAVEELHGLLVRDDVLMDLLLRAELGQAGDRVADVALFEQRDQLVSEARAGEVADVAGRDALAGEPDGVVVHAEAVAVLVADRAEDPSRVVDERAVVQDPDALRLEVGAAAERVDELADRVAFQRHRHCVDREVAAVEVLVDRPGLDRGEHSGRVVRLAAGRDDVDPSVVAVEDDGGAERAVRPDAPVELLGELVRQGDRVALDDDVEVKARLAEQDVANRAADEVDAVDTGR